VNKAAAAANEREVKLAAWPGFRLPDLDDIAPWMQAAGTSDRQLTATYFDTTDLRLIRAGLTVRHRTGEGGPDGRWTAKVPVPGAAADRTEVTLDAPAGGVPDAIISILRGVLRRGELRPVARLVTERHVVELRDGGGRRLGEVSDDEVSVLEGERVAVRFREIEIEVVPDAPPTLIALVADRLRAAGAGEPDTTPKLVRALGPRALAPPDPPVPSLGADPTAALVVQAAIAASVQRLLAHDPVIRINAGPEGIHQARVSTRRLRSDLKTFGPLVDTEWADGLRAELKEVAGALGAVRDADVLSERLEDAAGSLDRGDAVHALRLVRRLQRDREQKRAELLVMLDSDGYIDLLDRLVDAGRAPKVTEATDAPASKVLPDLAAVPWRKLRKEVRRLGPEPTDDELHQVRIRAKRARYAGEAAARAIPAAAKHASAIAELQGVLGDQHDAVVAEQWLRDAVAAGTSRQQAFAAGLLVVVERQDAAAKRDKWRKEWKAASAKKLAAWLRN
jgi:CHAD domain-containing protein